MNKSLLGRRTMSTAQTSALMNRIEKMSAQFRRAMRDGDFSLARISCESVLSAMPHNLGVLSDYALVLMRLGEYQQSYKIYKKIWQSPQRDSASETWLDGFAEVCGWLGRADELAQYGHLSLSRADAVHGQGLAQNLTNRMPAPFDSHSPEKNIISFSLYGNQPRYCETLIENVLAAKELYPAWTCRVYLDHSVPHHVWQRLRQDNVQLIDMSGENNIQPTLWRFLVMDDLDVERFIIRDADSLLSEREVAAVEEWLSSPLWFHHMRDYFTHTELLLAGMWGGCQGVFKDVGKQMREFIAGYKGAERFTDQAFLKTILWPTVRNSIMNHDELFNFHNARPFPAHPPIRWKTAAFHVGSNVGFQRIAGPAVKNMTNEQAFNLIINGERFSYTALVKDDEWSVAMPFFLVDALKAGNIKIEIIN